MRLIAKKHFYRSVAFDGIDFGKQPHPEQVAKGTVFTIGGSKKLEDKTLPNRDKELIAQLILSGSVADADNPAAVKAVQDELDIEARREVNAAVLDQAATNAGIAKMLASSMKKQSI